MLEKLVRAIHIGARWSAIWFQADRFPGELLHHRGSALSGPYQFQSNLVPIEISHLGKLQMISWSQLNPVLQKAAAEFN